MPLRGDELTSTSLRSWLTAEASQRFWVRFALRQCRPFGTRRRSLRELAVTRSSAQGVDQRASEDQGNDGDHLLPRLHENPLRDHVNCRDGSGLTELQWVGKGADCMEAKSMGHMGHRGLFFVLTAVVVIAFPGPARADIGQACLLERGAWIQPISDSLGPMVLVAVATIGRRRRRAGQAWLEPEPHLHRSKPQARSRTPTHTQ